jgi:hypothetical protein
MNAANADIIYVKQSSSGTTGADWANAFPTLQQALAVPPNPGDQIWVASGTYKPANSSSSFVLVDAVKVYGGFLGTSGTEGNFDTRDPNPGTNGTILSGDINGDDVPPPNPSNYSDNCSVVVQASTLQADVTVLAGFTVRGGKLHAIESEINNQANFEDLLGEKECQG